MLLPRVLVREGDPACWSWPAPGEAELGEMAPEARTAAMHAWHEGRCAICGCAAAVIDHDHETALVRGRLCRSCNVSEGYGNLTRDVFVKYRERNPASIWDVREVYCNAFTGTFAEPVPSAPDRWSYDALDGVL
jgi:Recombination endonuclease VII